MSGPPLWSTGLGEESPFPIKDLLLTRVQALVDRTTTMPLDLLVAPVAQIHPELRQSGWRCVQPARRWMASL